VPSDFRPPETHELYVGEGPEAYCFDFSECPTITAGGTISSPSIAIDLPKVSVGIPSINTQNFIQYDANGTVIGTVAAGSGVVVSVTALAQGQCEGKCQVQGSDGQKPIAAVIFKVRA
jgi:hypothetical protein